MPTLTHYSVDMGDITLDGFTVWPMESPHRRKEVREVIDAASKRLRGSNEDTIDGSVVDAEAWSLEPHHNPDPSSCSSKDDLVATAEEEASRRGDVPYRLTCEYCGTTCTSASKSCRVCGNLLSNIPPGGLKLPIVCQPNVRVGKR